MFKELFTSKAIWKIMAMMFMRRSHRLHVREISRLAKTDIFSTIRALKRLEAAGILRHSAEANLKFFEIDKTNPLMPELSAIIEKTEGVAPLLKSELENVAGVRSAFIYGSYARGEYMNTSDIDLMLIGMPEMGELEGRILAIEKKTSREINYSVMPADEFEKAKSEFIKRLRREKKIWLIGEHENI